MVNLVLYQIICNEVILVLYQDLVIGVVLVISIGFDFGFVG